MSIAAVMPTTSSRSAPIATISSLNSSVHERPEISSGQAGLGVDHADRVELVALVVLAWS